MKVIAKQCKECNLLVLLSDYKPHKSCKFGCKATCIRCETKKKESANKDPFNDKIWDESKLPCSNNAFLTYDIPSRYATLCRTSAYRMYIMYPDVSLDVIAEAILEGFELGNKAMSEVITVEMLKEVYL